MAPDEDSGTADTLRFRLRRATDRLSTSLWLVPGGASILAVVAAKVLPRIDAAFFGSRPGDGDELVDAWYLFTGEAASARELLSTIASSMMTFTGLVFSITILVLQLASQQFSPRVLRTFLEERTTRVAMASFMGSFLYAMALIPEIHGEIGDSPAFVPRMSVFFAFLLVLVSAGVFIHYIHSMAHAIRVVHIIERVAVDTRAGIDLMYPDAIGDDAALPSARPPRPPTQVVQIATSAGVVEAIDEDGLLEDARRHDAIIAVVPYLGDFVATRMPLFEIWSDGEVPEPALLQRVSFGLERTTHQDPAFGFRQLVDIAVRALSPGINDPTTAVQVLNQIHDLLRRLVTQRFPDEHRVDRDGRVRLILPRPGFESYVHLALDEIRRSGGSQLQIVRRLRALLDDLLLVAPPSRRAVLQEQLDLVSSAIDGNFDAPADRERARTASAQGHGAVGGEARRSTA